MTEPVGGAPAVFRRDTARVVLVDESDRLLLLLTRWPALVQRPPRWITPGGGIDPGETPHQAAVRELREETGLVVADLGEPVAERHERVEYSDGRVRLSTSTYYAHRAHAFEPSREQWTVEEHDDVLDVRWWTRAELEATAEHTTPEDLPALAASALAELRRREGVGP